MAKKIPTSWKPLEPGDVVDIIAPASGTSESGLKKAQEFLERWGLVPRVPDDLYGPDVLCANSDEKRFEHFKSAIQAKDSKVVWCVRGGYGSVRILPFIHKMKKPTRFKLFIGYSDITALHGYLNMQWNWPTLHSTMLEALGNGAAGRREINDLKSLLFGESTTLSFDHLIPLNSAAEKKKIIHSKIIGGNLAVVCTTLGTPWAMKPKGNEILVLEDIDERGYEVDRMLVHLKQAGILTKMKALIFGDFVGGAEKDNRYVWKAVQKQWAKDLTIPVLKGLPFGHGVFQRPMLLNTTCELKLGSRAKLVVHMR
jgi:muramoyltetrapeptide carboxypeptidase